MAGARQFAVEFIAKTTGWQKATGEASDSLGKVGKAAEDSADRLARAQATMEKAVAGSAVKIEQANVRLSDAAAKVEIAEKKKGEAIARYGEDSSQAATSVLKLGQAERSASSARANVTKATQEQTTAQERLTDVSGRLEKAQKGVNDEGGKGAGVGGKIKSAWTDAVGGFTGAAGGAGGLVGKLGALGAAAGVSMLVASQLSAAWGQAWEKSGGVTTLTAQLGMNADEAKRAGDAASELWQTGYGANIGEATSAVGAVMSSMSGLRTASASDLQDITGRAMGFAQVFGVDVAEATRNAGILISNGLAPDAVSAFDLMTASLQQVPQALRGEVMDATQEYSQFFAQLGYTGSEALALIGQTAATDGMYGVDKMGDAIKEFTIRATDGSVISNGAFKTLGLDAKSMANQLLAGGDTAKGAMDTIVGAMLGIKDPAIQAQTAVALFGTPLEDLGQDKLPAFLASLQGAGGGMADVAGKSDALKVAVESNLTPMEALTRAFQSTLSQGIEPFVGPVSSFAAWAKENPGLMQAAAIGVGILAVALMAAAVAMGVAALAASAVALPVAGIVLALGLLAVGIYALATNWGTIWGGIQSAAQVVGDWFAGPFAGLFVGIWNAITGAFSAAGAWIAGVFQGLWNWVAGVFSVLWGGLVAIFGGPIDTVRKIIEVFAAAGLMLLTAAWNGIVAAATWLWGQIVAIWTAISAWLSPYIAVLTGFITATWTTMSTGVIGAISFLRDSLVAIWTNLSALVRGIVQPLVDWAVGAFNGLRDRAVATFNDLSTKVQAVFSGLKSGIETVWNGIKAVFSAPVRWVVDVVINPLIRGFNTLADKVGMPQNKLTEWKFNGFARGGILPGYTPYARGDDRLVGMRSGEGVYVSEAMRDPRERARLHAVNTAALSGHSLDDFHTGGYAGGGIIGGVGTWTPTFAAEMIRAAQIAGINFLVSQRGFRPSTSYSGSTHNKDAVDVTGPVGQFGQIVAALRAVGIAAWDRTGKGNWVPHVHGVPLPGHGEASPSAAAQAADFLRGGDGLGGTDNASGAPAFDLLGALTAAFAGPLGKLKELSDSGFGGLVKGIPGMVVEGMKSKLTSVWNGAVGAVQAGGNFALASSMALGRGWGPGNIASLLWLIQKESGGRVNATNPSSGAYGIPQALPGSKMASAGADWRTNPVTQIKWMMDYISGRYGSADAAKSFHQSHNWYAAGTPSAAPGWAVVGERGPELVRFGGGEQVYPAGESARIAAGGVPGGVQVSFSIDEGRMRGLIRTEVRQMAREGAL